MASIYDELLKKPLPSAGSMSTGAQTMATVSSIGGGAAVTAESDEGEVDALTAKKNAATRYYHEKMGGARGLNILESEIPDLQTNILNVKRIMYCLEHTELDKDTTEKYLSEFAENSSEIFGYDGDLPVMEGENSKIDDSLETLLQSSRTRRSQHVQEFKAVVENSRDIRHEKMEYLRESLYDILPIYDEVDLNAKDTELTRISYEASLVLSEVFKDMKTLGYYTEKAKEVGDTPLALLLSFEIGKFMNESSEIGSVICNAKDIKSGNCTDIPHDVMTESVSSKLMTTFDTVKAFFTDKCMHDSEYRKLKIKGDKITGSIRDLYNRRQPLEKTVFSGRSKDSDVNKIKAIDQHILKKTEELDSTMSELLAREKELDEMDALPKSYWEKRAKDAEKSIKQLEAEIDRSSRYIEIENSKITELRKRDKEGDEHAIEVSQACVDLTKDNIRAFKDSIRKLISEKNRFESRAKTAPDRFNKDAITPPGGKSDDDDEADSDTDAELVEESVVGSILKGLAKPAAALDSFSDEFFRDPQFKALKVRYLKCDVELGEITRKLNAIRTKTRGQESGHSESAETEKLEKDLLDHYKERSDLVKKIAEREKQLTEGNYASKAHWERAMKDLDRKIKKNEAAIRKHEEKIKKCESELSKVTDDKNEKDKRTVDGLKFTIRMCRMEIESAKQRISYFTGMKNTYAENMKKAPDKFDKEGIAKLNSVHESAREDIGESLDHLVNNFRNRKLREDREFKEIDDMLWESQRELKKKTAELTSMSRKPTVGNAQKRANLERELNNLQREIALLEKKWVSRLNTLEDYLPPSYWKRTLERFKRDMDYFQRLADSFQKDIEICEADLEEIDSGTATDHLAEQEPLIKYNLKFYKEQKEYYEAQAKEARTWVHGCEQNLITSLEKVKDAEKKAKKADGDSDDDDDFDF